MRPRAGDKALEGEIELDEGEMGSNTCEKWMKWDAAVAGNAPTIANTCFVF